MPVNEKILLGSIFMSIFFKNYNLRYNVVGSDAQITLF